MTQCWFECPIEQGGNAPIICLWVIGKAQLHFLDIGRNANNWVVVSVMALFGVCVLQMLHMVLHMLERARITM